jgi:tetratricopeptide (TPR) repeat protein
MVTGRFDEAIPLLQRAITQNPEDPQSRCLLALCFINVGRAKEAVEMAGSAIALDPHAEWPHRIRSQALAAIGKGTKAMQEAEEAVRADPHEAMAFFVLSERLMQGRWRLKQAAAAARRGLALDPDSLLGHDLLARIELRRGRWQEAEIAYRKALQMQPQNWVLMNNLAIALRGQGRQQEAIAMLENAARANPRSTLAQRNLYLETRRYVGLGLFGFIVLFNVARVVLGNMKNDPEAALGVLEIVAIVAAVLLFIRWRRKRKLSPIARTFYAAESHRELVRTGPFVGVWLVGAIAVIFVSLMLFPSLQMGALLLMVGGVLGWWFAWRYLWLTMVHPWLRTRL